MRSSRLLPSVFSAAMLGAALLSVPASAQNVNDAGLMMDGGVLTVIYGQDCGPFSCQPFQAGPTAVGQPYNVYVFGTTQQFFALAADLDTNVSCLSIPGIGNQLLLAQPVTLAFGTIGPVASIGLCQQGRGQYTLQFPPATPPGVGFILQALVMSQSQGIPAFTVGIRSTT